MPLAISINKAKFNQRIRSNEPSCWLATSDRHDLPNPNPNPAQWLRCAEHWRRLLPTVRRSRDLRCTTVRRRYSSRSTTLTPAARSAALLSSEVSWEDLTEVGVGPSAHTVRHAARGVSSRGLRSRLSLRCDWVVHVFYFVCTPAYVPSWG